MGTIFLIVLIAISAYGIGRLILTRVRFQSTYEACAFSVALGLACLSYIIFILGLFALWHNASFLAVLLAASLLAILIIFRSLKLTKLTIQNADYISILFGGFLCAYLVFSFLLALSPPVDWDGLAYHLALPKLYLQRSQIYYVPYISHSNFPQTTEMLYGLALAFDTSGSLSKLIHYLFSLCLALSIYAFSRRYLSATVGLIAAAIFYSMPLVIWEAGSAYIDLSVALFSFLSIYSLCNYLSNRLVKLPLPPTYWLYLCAIFCGLALASKHTAIILYISLLIILLIIKLKLKVLSFKNFITFLIIALIIPTPWYIKSIIYTGNPVYPFLYSIFGGKYWDSACEHAYSESLKSLGLGRGFLSFILVLWNLTFKPGYFIHGNPIQGQISPLILAFLPATLFFLIYRPNNRSSTSILYILLSAAFLVYIGWFFSSQQVRFLLPALTFITILTAYAINRLLQINIIKPIILVCLIMPLSANLWLTAAASLYYFSYPSKEAYLTKYVQPYSAFKFINQKTPKNAKILLWGEPRGFYCNRAYLWGDPGHHTMIDFSAINDAKAFHRQLIKKFKITHILVNLRQFPGGWDSLDGRIKFIKDAMNLGLLALLYSSNDVYVFKIESVEKVHNFLPLAVARLRDGGGLR